MTRPRRLARHVALSVLALTALAPLRASADVQACLGASEKGQRARTAGKLREAREQFLVCSSEGCPAMVRRDCAQWQGEVIATLPSVVLGAKDRGGRDLFDVNVTIDGEPLAKKLDGKSIPVDPGPHTFKFEMAGAPAVIERALVKEGEKTRVIAVTFAVGTPASEPVAVVAPAPGHDAPPSVQPVERGHTVLPWVVVGVGGAVMITGLVFILTAPALPAGCNRDTRTCALLPGQSSAEFAKMQQDAARSDQQPVEGLIIGAVGLTVAAAGLLWHFLEPTGPSRAGALRFTPWAAPGSAGGSASADF